MDNLNATINQLKLNPYSVTRIATVKKNVASTCRKFAIEKLQSAQRAEAFENRVTTLLIENPPSSSDIAFSGTQYPIACVMQLKTFLATVALTQQLV